MNQKLKSFLYYSPRLLAAILLLQTLFYKFTAAPESVYIFETIGLEPWGRYLSGIIELIAGILLLTPLYFYGAILAIAVIIPAIIFHLTTLGVVVQNDGGTLFSMAILILSICLFLISLQVVIKGKNEK